MRTAGGFLFLFALALSFFAQTSPSLADKRVALVIGNASYAHTAALGNPRNDATDVAQALTTLGFDVTLKLDLEKRQIDQTLAQFGRSARTADAALFYYAGHGMQYQGKNYIMPVDAELQDELSLRYEMTAVDDVRATLQLSPGIKIMVLDACRNNPLAEKFVRSITLTNRGLAPKVQGYAPSEKSQGMIVVYATQADDVAEDGAARNSPFSEAFLKELKEPGLEVETMFRRIARDVYAATKGQQSPELAVSVVPEYSLNQAETDQTVWARIRSQADVSTLRVFLDRYPNSFYAPDARDRLDLLEREVREKSDREATEQQKRLTDGEAAKQAAAEARNRADSEKLEKERAQREADLRAQIDREQAASSAEKKGLLPDSLEKDRDQQKLDEQARADRERAANDEKTHQLQAEAERAQALKVQIANLEQQAQQAKTDADAQLQKVQDAKKAAADAEAARIASLTPAAGSSPADRSLVPSIEAELRRIGCFAGADADWDSPSVRLGVAKFARYAKLGAPTAPDAGLLDSLKNAHDRVCPPECSVREVVVNGRCAPKGCPHGELLSREGVCYARPVAPRPAPIVRAAAPPREQREAVRRPAAAAKSHCFNFNGSQYCE